ncbi:hypothetical protein C7271_13735 [filamentous cyanobacterium CCP5]|nr:hypothetical protein C7271_13735 [filamentous cyanobacterium CCP5]
MLFDRILEDALGFIRRLLWWRSQTSESSAPKPFQSMRAINGEYGVIALVTGRDTPRAVRTWIYSPKRLDLNSTKALVREPADDLHIYLDFLGPLPGVETPKAQQERKDRQQKRRLGEKIHTHRLQILKASHFLNENGFYDYQLIFWEDFDFFWPISQGPDHLARITLDRLAYWCLNHVDPIDLSADDWAAALRSVWGELTSQSSTNAAKPSSRRIRSAGEADASAPRLFS